MDTEILTLLVVEDSPEDRETVLRTLGRSRPGWRLIAAETGDEALQRFADTPPDLVLLDLQLPDADGIELLPILTGGDGRPVPVVLLTGRGDQSAAVKALKLGARDYLVKDVAGSYLATLVETLERVLDEHQVDQESRRLHWEAAGRQERLAQIAERRGQDVQRLEYRMRRVVEQNMDGLLVVARDGGVLLVNPVGEYLLSCDPRLLETLTAGDPPRDGAELTVSPVAGAPEIGPVTLEIRSRPLQWDGSAATLFALHDITARKAAERALAVSERRFRRLVESAPDAVVISDGAGRIRIVNDEARRMFGYSNDRLVGQPVEILLPEEVRERHVQHRQDFLARPTIRLADQTRALLARRNDGSKFPVEITLSPMESEEGTLITAIVRDISVRVHTEQHLRRLNRTYELLSAGNHILIRSTDEQALLDAYCRKLVGDGGYLLACVGYAEETPEPGIRGVARADARGAMPDGPDNACFATACLHHGPALEALRCGAPVVARDGFDGQEFASCCSSSAERDFRSAIALPLKHDGTAFGVLNLYSRERERFDQDEVRLLAEMADDLAFGIRNLRSECSRRKTEQELRLRNRAVESAKNGIILTDARSGDHPIVYVNPAFEGITGYPAAEAMGRNPRFLARDDRRQAGMGDIRKAVRERCEGTAILRNYRKDGSLFWNHLHIAPVTDEAGEITHFVGILSDVTNEKNYLEELEHQATHDQLTGLYNRNLMRDRLCQAITMAARAGHHVGVLFLDLDRFKVVNDSLGHAAGDELLKAVAQRLRESVRDGDTVARYGGDEFVIVLPDLDSPAGCAGCAERVLARSGDAIEIAGEEVRANLTIGAAVYPRDGGDADTLLKNADAAMYRGKREPGDGLRYFTDDLSREARERLHLERDLRRALERGQLMMHYQPQVHLADGRCVRVEALVRWRHPQDGPIPPDRFIPLAEESGLILALGEWVLRQACDQAAQWTAAEMAVNVSARQLQQEGFVDTVRAALEASGLAPQRLELELTESVLMADPELMLGRLRDLKALGVKLSLDDFGTGYSSLSYLKRFPFDRLKIDRSFVRDLPHDPNDAAIAATIVAMARSLGLGVVAEGVETAAQCDFLLREGCDCGQGWLFAKPMPAAELPAFLLNCAPAVCGEPETPPPAPPDP